MEIITLFFLALGLSMDAFAVSVSNGMCFCNIHKKQVLLTALTFGAFQAIMPVIGFFAGQLFNASILAFDHWIALILLSDIGGKMIFTGVRELRNPESCRVKAELTGGVLLVQGIATSVDAFAVGISFAVMQVNIVVAASFIGMITFACCIFGAYLGKKFGGLIQQRAEILGGSILVAIGIKIFLEGMLGG